MGLIVSSMCQRSLIHAVGKAAATSRGVAGATEQVTDLIDGPAR